MCVLCMRAVVQTRGTASYPQRLALLVEQVGDVLRHPLHQVPGVVPLDLELALLLIVNLQRGSTQGESNTRSPELIVQLAKSQKSHSGGTPLISAGLFFRRAGRLPSRP